MIGASKRKFGWGRGWLKICGHIHTSGVSICPANLHCTTWFV